MISLCHPARMAKKKKNKRVKRPEKAKTEEAKPSGV
jgi:hypothetical protein